MNTDANDDEDDDSSKNHPHYEDGSVRTSHFRTALDQEIAELVIQQTESGSYYTSSETNDGWSFDERLADDVSLLTNDMDGMNMGGSSGSRVPEDP